MRDWEFEGWILLALAIIHRARLDVNGNHKSFEKEAAEFLESGCGMLSELALILPETPSRFSLGGRHAIDTRGAWSRRREFES